MSTFTEKKFVVKIYDSVGTTLKTTLNPGVLKNKISFTSRINGGYGQCVLDLQLPFDNFGEGGNIDFMSIVNIYEIDENNQNGRLIYKGFISAYKPYFRGSKEGVMIVLLGVGSLLGFAMYKNGANFTVTQTTVDPAVIFKDIIDKFQAVYAGSLISYDVGGTTIATVGTNVSYTYENKPWMDALRDTFDLVDPGWYWRINESGVVYLKQKPSTATHTFTIGKDIEEMIVEKSSEDIINQVRVIYNSGANTKDATDATSITNFGKRERVISDDRITELTTATQRSEKPVTDNKDEKIKATMTINSLYDIETIKVGDTCKIKNLSGLSTTFSDNMQIVAVTYDFEFVKLELEELTNFFGIEMTRFIS